MEYSPKISAVIPAYNAADYIGKAIESILAQTYPVHELFVVDDGSSDATAEVAARYGAPVTLLRQKNGGPGAARNNGARRATGDWIGLLDADDAWLPHKLETQIPLTRNEGVGIVQSWDAEDDNTPPDDISFARLWHRNCIANSSVLIRRSAFEAVGGYDEDRELIAVEDYNLWLRLVGNGWKVATHYGTLVDYYSAPGHLSSQFDRATRAEFVNIEKIGRVLNLDSQMVRQKRLSVCERQGRHLLYHREMRRARELLRVPLREKPSPKILALWLATFVPPALLDRRRSRPGTTQAMVS